MLPLYDYQQKVVKEMLAGKFLNASRIGSGKTLMSLGFLEATKSQQSLLVAPKSLVLQWQSEAEKFWPEMTVVPVLGSEKKRMLAYQEFNKAKGPKLLAISYDLIREDIAKFIATKFDSIIFDEVHKLKEPKSKTRDAIKMLKSTHRIGLSGSPLVNHYGNLFCIMNILKPDEFPNYWKFIHTHAVLNKWRGVLFFKNEANLRQIFQEHMTMAEFNPADYMPGMVEIPVPITLSDKEAKIYDKARKLMLLEFEEGDISKLSSPVTLDNSLVRLGKLQEIANSLELVGDHKDSSKIEALKELLQDQIAEDEKVIIFTRFARFAKIIQREVGGEMIIGETEDRAGAVKRFQEGGKVLVGTNAMREGLNLTEANVVIMADQDFTSASHDQRIGRAWRLGQKKQVRVYHLLSEGTVDHKFVKLVNRKKKASDILLGELIKD